MHDNLTPNPPHIFVPISRQNTYIQRHMSWSILYPSLNKTLMLSLLHTIIIYYIMKIQMRCMMKLLVILLTIPVYGRLMFLR